MFESRNSAGASDKLPGWEKPHAKTVAWSSDMEGSVGVKYLQFDARREDPAARKGKWSPRGTGTTVLTYPGSAPR